jgi:predicted metal-dependent hydrolase
MTVVVESQLTGFIRCVNQQAYYDAHDVLEELWLKTRGEPRDLYKGLIQTAAVFLKLQQGKPDPAARLALRAASHLEKYRPVCERVDVELVLDWLRDVGRGRNAVAEGTPPQLELLGR